MKTIDRKSISQLVSKALLQDIKSNLNLLKLSIREANKLERHQVDPEESDTELAFSLWAFVYNTIWLEQNVEDEELRQSLIQLSSIAYGEMTGVPVEIIDKWLQQMKASREMVERTGKPGYIALPVMFYLGYGDYRNLQTQLSFSYAATLYGSWLNSVSGYWKKSFELYKIQ